MIREKALDRAAKLQAQMESETQLGNRDAAQAFAAMVSRLVLEHALEADEIAARRDAGITPPEEPIVTLPVNLRRLGLAPARSRNAHLERLSHAISRAHLCKFLVQSGSNSITFVGTERATEACEYVLAAMWRALRQLTAEGRKQARRDNPRLSLRGYNETFRESFIDALGVRYRQEQAAVVVETDARETVERMAAGMPDTPAASTALMRIDRQMQRVKSYVDGRYGKARAIGGYSRIHNGQADRDGRAAAQRVNLRASGLGAGAGRRELTA